MGYTRAWDDAAPPDGRDADEIGAAIRELRVDIHQRMNTYFIDFDADPLVPVAAYSGAVTDRALMIDAYGFAEVTDGNIQPNDGYCRLESSGIGNTPTFRKGIIIPVGYSITSFEAWMNISTSDVTTISLRVTDVSTGVVTNITGNIATTGDGTIKYIATTAAPLPVTITDAMAVTLVVGLDVDNDTDVYGFRIKITKDDNSTGY